MEHRGHCPSHAARPARGLLCQPRLCLSSFSFLSTNSVAQLVKGTLSLNQKKNIIRKRAWEARPLQMSVFLGLHFLNIKDLLKCLQGSPKSSQAGLADFGQCSGVQQCCSLCQQGPDPSALYLGPRLAISHLHFNSGLIEN